MTYGFHWAEGDVGNELGAGRADGPTDGLVLGLILGTDSVLVDIFEDLVETELAEALGTVAEESWDPTLNKWSVMQPISQKFGRQVPRALARKGESKPAARVARRLSGW